MSRERRKFSEEDKTNILQLAKQSNISKVLREYNLSYSVFSRWKQQIENSFIDRDDDIIALRTENIRLKRIVAEQALELEIKREKERKK